MSFFLRSRSSSKEPDNQGKGPDQDDAFQDMMLDPDEDNFQVDEYKAPAPPKSVLLSMAPIANMPSPAAQSKPVVDEAMDDDGDLEITGVQEKEVQEKTRAHLPKGRSMTSRPMVKIRKTESPNSPKLSFFSQADKSIEPLLTAISNLQSEKRGLQAELNTYVNKYEMNAVQLARSTEKVDLLGKRIQAMKDQQVTNESDFLKLSEGHKTVASQVESLQAEKAQFQATIEDLKNNLAFAQSKNEQLTQKFHSFSQDAKIGELQCHNCIYLLTV